MLADQAVEQGPHLSNDEIEVQHSAHHHLAPTEREQLTHQRRPTIGGALDLLQPGSLVRVRVSVGKQELGVSDDDRQQVVEVVCHATGQQTHRLHALRIVQGLGLPLECGTAFGHTLLQRLVGLLQ